MGVLPVVCHVGGQGGMPYHVTAADRAVPSTEFSGLLVKTARVGNTMRRYLQRGTVCGWSTSGPFSPSVGTQQSKSSG